MTYTPRTFDLPELKGISKKQVEVHLALYEGYVKHMGVLAETIKRLRDEGAEKNMYAINEVRRRLGFEFDGMRMHEYYFEQFEGSAKGAAETSPLQDAVGKKYGDWKAFIAHLKEVAGTRGIGWTIAYFDPAERVIYTAWVDDHQLGQLSGLPIILAIDMWEHAYMVDYAPKDKMSYVDAFLENVNWSVAEKRFVLAAT